MTDDFLRDLQRFQRHAAVFGELAASTQAAWPERVEATDSSGTLHVVLGPDGLPESMQVGSGWRRTLGSEAFGRAVVEACQVATNERMAVWTRTLEERGWPATFDRLRDAADDDRDDHGAAPRDAAPDPAAGVLPDGLAEVRPRPLDVVIKEILRAVDVIDDLTRAPVVPAEGTGSTAFGKLVLTVSGAGVVSCTADPEWVSRQEAEGLTDALNRALTSARAELAATATTADSVQRLDGLLGEVLAILRDPRRLA